MKSTHFLLILGLLFSLLGYLTELGFLFIVFFPLFVSALFLGNIMPYLKHEPDNHGKLIVSSVTAVFSLYALTFFFTLLLRQTFAGIIIGIICSLLVFFFTQKVHYRIQITVLMYFLASSMFTFSQDWVEVFNIFLVFGIVSRVGEVFYSLEKFKDKKFRTENWFARTLTKWIIAKKGSRKISLEINDEDVTYEFAAVDKTKVSVLLSGIVVLIFLIYFVIWIEASVVTYDINSLETSLLDDSTDYMELGIPTSRDYIRIVSNDQVYSLAIRNKKSYDWSSWTDVSDSDNIILNPQFASKLGLEENQMYWILPYEPDTFYQKIFGRSPAYLLVNVNNPNDKKTVLYDMDVTEEKYFDKGVRNIAWWNAPWFIPSDPVPTPTDDGELVWVVPEYLDLNFLWVPWYVQWTGEILIQSNGDAYGKYFYSVESFKKLLEIEPWLGYTTLYPQEIGEKISYIYGMNRKGWWNRFVLGPNEGLIEIPEFEAPYLIQTEPETQRFYIMMEPRGVGSRNLFGYFTIITNGRDAGDVRFVKVPDDRVVYGPNVAESSVLTSIRTETAYSNIYAKQAILYNLNNTLSYIIPITSSSSEVGGEGFEYVFLKYIGIVDPENAESRSIFVKFGETTESVQEILNQALAKYDGSVFEYEGTEIDRDKLLELLLKIGKGHALLSDLQEAIEKSDSTSARDLIQQLTELNNELEQSMD